MELDPARACSQASFCLGDRFVVGIHPTERDEAIALASCLEHRVVGRRITIGLVHRKHERAARSSELEGFEQLVRALLHPIGIVLAEMRVRVEQLYAGDLPKYYLEPRPEDWGEIHGLIRTMKVDGA